MSSKSAGDGSASSGAGLPSLTASLRTLCARPAHEHDPSDVLHVCFQVMLIYRQCILQAVAAEVSGVSGGRCVSAQTLQSAWDSRVEDRIVAAMGVGVRSDAPAASKTRGCGPIIAAMMSEWKQRTHAGTLRTLADVVDAFSSPRMLEFHTKYAETFLPSNVLAHKHQTHTLVASAIDATMREWATMMRSSSAKMLFTVEANAADFRRVLCDSNRLFVAVYDLIRPIIGKSKAGSANNGQANRMAQQLEVTRTHGVAQTRFEHWFNTTYKPHHAQGTKAAASSHADAVRHRTCKAETCVSASGRDIGHGQYTAIACTEGCVFTMHPACFHEAEAQESMPCIRKEEQGCKGTFRVAILKQDGKVLARLLGADAAAMSSSEHKEAEDLSEEEEASCADAGAEDHTAVVLNGLQRGHQAMLAGQSAGIDVVGRRFRDQRTPSYLRTVAKSRLGRVQVMSDGTMAYADQVERLADIANKAEKREQAERKKQQQAVKKALEANCKPAALAPASAPATDAPSAAPKSAFKFEVVVMGKKPPPVPVPTPTPALVAEDPEIKKEEQTTAPESSATTSVEASSTILKADATNPTAAAPKAPTPNQTESPSSKSFASVLQAKGNSSKPSPRKSPSQPPALIFGRTKADIVAARRIKKAEKEAARVEQKRLRMMAQQEEARIDAAPLVLEADKPSSTQPAADAEKVDDEIKRPESVTVDSSEPDLELLSDTYLTDTTAADSRSGTPMSSAFNSSFSSLSNFSSNDCTPQTSNFSSPVLNATTNVSPSSRSPPLSTEAERRSPPLLGLQFPLSESELDSPCPPNQSSPLLVLPKMSCLVSTPNAEDAAVIPSAPFSGVIGPSSHHDPLPTSLQLVEDVLEAEAGVCTSVLLLRNLPSSVSLQMLGNLFCSYSRLRVNLTLTNAHGLTGVLQLASTAAARKAVEEMRRRVFELRSQHSEPSADFERWVIDDIVFGEIPLTVVPMPAVSIRLLGFAREPLPTLDSEQQQQSLFMFQ